MSTDSDQNSCLFTIGEMQTQFGVLDGLDWSGITDPAERRRRQNCLNQRKHRTRRRAGKLNIGDPGSNRSHLLTFVDKERAEDTPGRANLALTRKAKSQPSCINSHPRVMAAMNQFAQYAYDRYHQGAPDLKHLPLLVQFNVNAAFEHIADLMGIMADHHDYDAISPFSKRGPALGLNSTLTPYGSSWPQSLHPTPLQFSVEHHPWIDLFPFPQLRDNLIMVIEAFPEICDEDELCRDLCQYDGDLVQKSSLLVWGEASNPLNWEASLMFIDKWGFLLYGCEDLLKATNYWRVRRGEQRISVDVLSVAVVESFTKALSRLST